MPRQTYGLVLNKLRRFAEAEEVLRTAAETDPASANLLCMLALSLLEQKKLGEAEKICADALQLEPNLWVAQNMLGVIRQGQNKFADAETEFRTAIRLFIGIPNLAALVQSNLDWRSHPSISMENRSIIFGGRFIWRRIYRRPITI